jgi:hypothetical protein
MTDTTQETILVGIDAHSEKIALCITRWQHGLDPIVLKSITTTLDSLENTYKRQVPAGALTVLEASTNAFSIVRRLRAVGQCAKVLVSDTLAGRARADRINDRIDAQNAKATQDKRRGLLCEAGTASPRLRMPAGQPNHGMLNLTRGRGSGWGG